MVASRQPEMVACQQCPHHHRRRWKTGAMLLTQIRYSDNQIMWQCCGIFGILISSHYYKHARLQWHWFQWHRCYSDGFWVHNWITLYLYSDSLALRKTVTVSGQPGIVKLSENVYRIFGHLWLSSTVTISNYHCTQGSGRGTEWEQRDRPHGKW